MVANKTPARPKKRTPSISLLTRRTVYLSIFLCLTAVDVVLVTTDKSAHLKKKLPPPQEKALVGFVVVVWVEKSVIL